jgi:hypothetical protein
MPRTKRHAAALCAAALLAGLLGTGSLDAPSGAAPAWAPAASASIRPGVQTLTDGAQCTSNFVFYDAADVYIGQAAHCSGTGGSTETNGCTAGSLPLGTPVEVGGATRPGTMVYNSWLTMQARGETNADVCQFNDFALVRLDPADVSRVNPTVPHWGGPAGLATSGTTLGERVFSYGNSSLRGGLAQLSPKTGVSTGDAGAGWSHNVLTFTPGIPGDSGSAFLDGEGRALGVLSTLQLAPLPASNGVGDLPRELSYLEANSSLSVQLAAGTQPFDGSRLPLGLG